MSEKIILGIDPGTQVTGYGIIVCKGNSFHALDYGCIRPPRNALLSDRYFIIFESLAELFKTYTPAEVAIETPIIAKNAQSALKLGCAQGVAIIQAKKHKVQIFGYSPTQIKCAITGTGKASKTQLQGAVARFLHLAKLPQPQDASDALACALCHAHSSLSLLFSKLVSREI